MPPPGLLEFKSQQPRSSLLPVSDEKGLLGALGLGLGDISRRKLLQGVTAAAIPKFPLQSVLKGVDLSSSSLNDLYKLQAKLKKRIVEWIGSTILVAPDDPGGFKGLFHEHGHGPRTPLLEASEKYFDSLTKDYEKLTEVMSKKKDTWTQIAGDPKTKPALDFYGSSTKHITRWGVNSPEPIIEEGLSETLRDVIKKDTVPFDYTEDRPSNYRTWGHVEEEVRGELLERERVTGRTLVTRSSGPGKTLPIGSSLQDAAEVAERLPKGYQHTYPPDLSVNKSKRLQLESPETKPQPQPQGTNRPLLDSPRVTRTASPPVQFPSGRDISRMAMRGATTAAGWPLYAASFGIPTARSGESQVLAELADQPGADMDAALRAYRQGLAQQQAQRQQELSARGGLLMSGMP